MGKIRLVYVLFGISPRIWNGLRTHTEVPLYLEKTCPSAALSTTNPICCPDAHPGPHGGKLATNCLSYGVVKGHSCKGYDQDNVIQETQKGRTFGRKCQPKPECSNGIRSRDVKETLHLRRGRKIAGNIRGWSRRQQLRLESMGNGNNIFGKTIGLDILKREPATLGSFAPSFGEKKKNFGQW
jgi:hypothetical protein